MTFPTELKRAFMDRLTRKKMSYSQGWSNFMGTVKNPAAVVIDVESEEQVQFIMKEIKKMNENRTPKNKITLRACAGWDDKKSDSCCLFPWAKVQEAEYGSSFSFSEVVGGRASPQSEGTDIIIRFKKKFHKAKVLGPATTKPAWINPDNPIHQLPAMLVEVNAGMQVAEYAEFLRKNNLSSSTISMLCWASLVGLFTPGGHGTGRDEPAISGLIESIRVCDLDGTIRELTPDHPDFETLCAANSGFLGIILSVKIRAVKAFNLRETVDVFHNTEEMKGKLGDILKNNQYVSIMGMPSTANSELSENIHQWQIRKWNFTTEKPTQSSKATYAPTGTSFVQELGLRLGADLMNFLVNSELRSLLPEFMLIAAAESIEGRGTKPIVDFENHITHPQVAFPKVLRDVDYFIPVKDDKAGEQLEKILRQIESQLNNAAKRGENPVTYAIYVRYLKGTNGGLSPTSTHAPDERIIALDVVTHPQARGIARFEKEFLGYLREQGFEVRNHLGKEFPAGVVRYSQFLDPKNMKKFVDAAERWNATPGENDGAERLAMAPYNTNYFQEMLDTSPQLASEMEEKSSEEKSTKEELLPPKKQTIEYTKEEHIQFLNRLCDAVELMQVHNDAAKNAKAAFLKTCQSELENRRLHDLVIS
ncbi:L-gulono-gamma-lactone oxidase [Legionella steigerwaltii]|uniref:L-gulono-gamma-lactone oxidase n=1 Tax=Legionella steigerwaltii TaxID=460 RepID=A0A378LIN8_9GAMM|nr:L-gulono-gamma-lactone oxidase [Legionella steigerwaltii]STY23961.1 L-gulono-gamma-lactone oxidase [Legionella steigerwaltii]